MWKHLNTIITIEIKTMHAIPAPACIVENFWLVFEDPQKCMKHFVQNLLLKISGNILHRCIFIPVLQMSGIHPVCLP